MKRATIVFASLTQRAIIAIFCAFTLSACVMSQSSPNAPVRAQNAPNVKYVSDVLPNDAYLERFTGNGAELERFDAEIACDYVGVVAYHPLERYAALLLTREGDAHFYPNIIFPQTYSRVFANNISAKEARKVGEYCESLYHQADITMGDA